jgi:serine/threonine protein kinase
MPQIACLRCQKQIESAVDACPHCGERVTSFQRTYATKLIDGKYQILERLGLGGMGEIFKVRHIHLNEQRVIKIMRANIATDDQAMQRFLHEARTSTMIKHRNLAMLYDFSTLDDGSYYMVWEFIEGTNIQKWIAKNGPIPSRLTVEIAIQALHGLENLHSMGLIHRDVSPENIMLSSDHQGKLLVKVIDFGIAKQLSEGEGGQGLTQTGMFLGKLKYASPEQAGFIKEGEHLDARSDLYSFGVVLYEMLSGRAPFLATNPQGYILKHATEKPLPISQVSPQVKVPAALEAEVFKSLEKDRDRRQPSAADFAADLEALRASIPPDEKYGVGDWRGTISSQQTLPSRTPGARTVSDTASAPTVTGQPERTLTDANEPTVAERMAAPAAGGEATVVDRALRAEAEATIAERVAPTGADAEPTRIETLRGQRTAPDAEPTVIEKKFRAVAAEPQKKTGTWIAVAAAVLLLVGGGIWFARRNHAPAPVRPTVPITATQPPTGTATTATTGTTEVVTAPPVSPGTSDLQLVANPYGSVEKLVNVDTHTPVPMSAVDDENSTPLLITLKPGNYELTVKGPEGDTKTLNVRLDAGVRRTELVTFHSPNLDTLSEDVLKP